MRALAALLVVAACGGSAPPPTAQPAAPTLPAGWAPYQGRLWRGAMPGTPTAEASTLTLPDGAVVPADVVWAIAPDGNELYVQAADLAEAGATSYDELLGFQGALEGMIEAGATIESEERSDWTFGDVRCRLMRIRAVADDIPVRSAVALCGLRMYMMVVGGAASPDAAFETFLDELRPIAP